MSHYKDQEERFCTKCNSMCGSVIDHGRMLGLCNCGDKEVDFLGTITTKAERETPKQYGKGIVEEMAGDFAEIEKIALATENQIDGTHYNKLKIQPIMLAYSLNASPCFCKLAKYITRDKDDKAIQLDKAIHCIELERDLIIEGHLYGMAAYGYEINGIPNDNQKIADFSNQFSNSSYINNALKYLYNEQYDEAIKEVEKLKELL